MLSEYSQLSSADIEILVFAGIFPGFPVTSITNDFTPVLLEYADELVEYQALNPSATTTTTATTTSSVKTSTTTGTTDAITPTIGFSLGFMSILTVVFIRVKKRKTDS